MNIFQFIQQFGTNDLTEVSTQKVASRREAFRMLGASGKKLAAVAVPFGLAGGLSQTARAQSMESTVTDTLNFALLLEYLEDDFYRQGLDKGDIPSGKDMSIFQQISKHESAHVAFLKTAISGAGATPIEFPEGGFDFTAGGAFPDPFASGNYAVFLALSQAFEDTGVRAYKGQAGNLVDNATVLTAALQIHSVEARHASEVRRLRGEKGWITQAERGTGMPSATDAVYAGEDNLIQGGVDVTTVTTVGADGVTEAYDEPLSKEDVTAIASLFLG
uniref:Ferritin-like domain-containing protein n=1 Tax=Roseihalotalea indica TaxID=2867963 RepID=A0AA49JIB9_9BACT|nr:ferritin-like domain-containing protein [Tunicatimonas sp. TK19036]